MAKKNPPGDPTKQPLQLALLDMIGQVEEETKNDPPPEKNNDSTLKTTLPSEHSNNLKDNLKETGSTEKNAFSSSNSIDKSSVESTKKAPGQTKSKKPKVFSITDLISSLNKNLRENFRNIWVEGELGRVTRRNNIYYLSVKDDKSLLEAVLMTWNYKPSFTLEEGLKIRMRGELDIYAPRGKLSFQIKYIEKSGEGDLAKAFEELKKKLAAEGLFDKIHKKPLPSFPTSVGVISSLKSAAFNDILKIATTRVGCRIVGADAIVQGKNAPDSIISALKSLIKFGKIDIIIVARGGGSAEDLACFNDESLVREIFACPIPVVTGVGHQIDFTLVDFVSDVRGATPTEAAEIVFVNREQPAQNISQLKNRIFQNANYKIQNSSNRLLNLSGRIIDPQSYLYQKGRDLDSVILKMERAVSAQLKTNSNRFETLKNQFNLFDIKDMISRKKSELEALRNRLINSTRTKLQTSKESLILSGSKLSSLNPHAVLNRGYAMISTADGAIITSPDSLKKGTLIDVKFSKGKVTANVEEIDFE